MAAMRSEYNAKGVQLNAGMRTLKGRGGLFLEQEEAHSVLCSTGTAVTVAASPYSGHAQISPLR